MQVRCHHPPSKTTPEAAAGVVCDCMHLVGIIVNFAPTHHIRSHHILQHHVTLRLHRHVAGWSVWPHGLLVSSSTTRSRSRSKLTAQRYNKSIVCRYSVCLLGLNYVIPLAVLVVTYVRVGLNLWGSQVIGEYTHSQTETIKSKRRVSMVVGKLAM